MKVVKYVFHISDPNNEDVEPIALVAKPSWLAVADGMGGSGCMKHVVRERNRSSLSRILEYVLPEYKNDSNEQDKSPFRKYVVGKDSKQSYLERIFDPCIREEVNTSARWASRIVMTRFLYYITEKKFDPNNPDEIVALRDFLKKGLKQTVDALSLTVSDPNMSLLPTTFAALRYYPLSGSETDDDCEVHAIWAGDSRCYLLNKDGLARLSADDEDEYKQLTNTFDAEGQTELHCRRYVLKKPFLLFCASDGFFDAYDKYELSVEANLLNDIFEAKDFPELWTRLKDRYKRNVADDTSVALACVGFSESGEPEYGKLLTMLADRWKKVKELYEQHRNYAHIASLISRPEQLVTGTICDRFETKFSEIVKRIIVAGFQGREDPLVTPHWRQLISESVARKKEEFNGQTEKRKTEFLRTVLEEIGKSDYETCFAGFPDSRVPWGSALKSYRDVAYSQRDRLRREECQLTEWGRSLDEKRDSYLSSFHENMNEAFEALQDLLNGKSERCTAEQSEQLLESRYYYCKRLEFWAACERYMMFKDKSEPTDRENVAGADPQFIAELRKYRNRRTIYEQDVQTADKKREKQRKDLVPALSKLEQYLSAMLESRNKVFTKEFIKKLHMDEIMSSGVSQEELLDAVMDELLTKYENDREILCETLDAWKKITDQKTCIDDLFAAGKLSDFRQYYKNKNLSESEEFCRYMQDLEQIESEYGRMLRLVDEA